MTTGAQYTIPEFIWGRLFAAKFGICMPRWLADIAKNTLKDHDDVQHIVSEMVKLLPLLTPDKSVTEELGELYARLRIETSKGTVLDRCPYVRDSADILTLDDRTCRRFGSADACVNPYVLMSLLNSVVVYCDDDRMLKTAHTVYTRVLESGEKACLISPYRDAFLCGQLEGCEYNTVTFGHPEMPRGKRFSEMLPKLCGLHICVTSWKNVNAGDYPDGTHRFTHRNLLIVDAGETERRLPHLCTGYARILCVAPMKTLASCVPPLPSELREAVQLAVPYALSLDEDEFVAKLNTECFERHIKYDGTERGKGGLMFYDALLRGHDAVTRALSCKRRGREPAWMQQVALMAIETRENATLVACLARSAWATGIRRIVILTPAHQMTASVDGMTRFYSDALPHCDVSVIALPPKRPFLRPKAFHMTAYNDMMTRPDMWRLLMEDARVPEAVIIVQDDGCFIRRVPRDVVRNWVTTYEYIGAPWHQNNARHLHDLVPGLVGNGGISLRRVKTMLDMCEHPSADDVRNVLYEDTFDMPEDVFFCHLMGVARRKVAPEQVARKFAMEQVRTEDAYALHKVWMYHASKTVGEIMANANLELGIVSPETSSWTSSSIHPSPECTS